MSDFTFNPKFITKSDDLVIELIKNGLKERDSFEGIGLEKTYIIKYVGSSSVKYIGKERNTTKPEEISFDDIKSTFRTLKSLSVFNTSTEILKEKIPGSLYRLRTPFFAILLETQIIIRINEN
jgi:hypothetical protein